MVDAGDSPRTDAGDASGSDADSRDADSADAADDGNPSATSPAAKETSREPVPAGPAKGRRTVIVPEGLFRIVVVFSTVLSILAILLGFVLLDTATGVVENPSGSVVVELIRWAFGLSLAAMDPHLSTLALVVGLLGVGCIGLGVWIYAIGTRFRTEMGKPKEQADEGSDNG